MHDSDALIDALLVHPAIPDRSFAELLIIKEVFDIYNRGYFFREALLMLLDSISTHPIMPEHGRYALEVKENLTRLKPGNTPPDFSLLDISGEKITLNELKGKYVYLNFCTPDNYSCLKEFPFLDAIHSVHEDYLNIVTILVANDHTEMVNFVRKNNYKWTFLFYGNSDAILTDYAVKAFPTCYLLDQEGIMLQSPAVLPTEDLEKHIFRIMRSRGDL
jgi:peroxiredoxin